MKQSRLMSLVEAVANVIVGHGVAGVSQILIFPVFGRHTTLAQNLKMDAVFTVLSIARPASCGGCAKLIESAGLKIIDLGGQSSYPR